MSTETKSIRSCRKTLLRCRTCELTNEKHSTLHPLNECPDSYPNKTIADLLLEICKINTKADDEGEQLPSQLCNKCRRKLYNAYDFMIQAQCVNKRLLASLQPKDAQNKHSDCLVEAPIDIPTMMQVNEYLQIKMEVEAAEDERGTTNKTILPVCDSALLHSAAVKENKILRPEQLETATDIKLDPITIGEAYYRTDEEDIEENNDDSLSAYQMEEHETESDEDYKPPNSKMKRRRASRHVCDVCGNTFAWKKDLQRHKNSHYGTPKHQCDYCDRQFLRKDKLNDHMKIHLKHMDTCKRQRPTYSAWNFAERLYTGQRFRKIQCKLCLDNFENIPALRQHILIHTAMQNLSLDLDSDVVKEIYPHERNLDEIKESICSEISSKRLSKFCAVVNAYGYEMALSDSDNEDDDDAANVLANKYACELCKESFGRKYQVIAHIRQKHLLDKLPYQCTVCKIEFVNGPMYHLHTRSQCRSKEKKYQCLKCPGKFMWLENLEGHQCSNRFNRPEYKAQLPRKRSVLHCTLCDKTFVWLKDLKRHMETHDADAHECSLCLQRFLKAENLRLHVREVHEQNKPCLQCRLCEQNCDKLAQLRIHLQQHADGVTGVDTVAGQFYKIYHPEGIVGSDMQVANEIADDFRKQNISRFYCAVDVGGNELDINDSETDADLEDTKALCVSSYPCDVCNQSFNSRKFLLQHQQSDHADLEKLPHACNHCQRQFVSLPLLQKHLKRDCLNVYKKLECEKCSSRFVWAENLQLHNKISHIDTEQRISLQLANKLQCDQCDKVFIWPKDLTRHKRIHLPDDEKYECPVCERKFNRKDNMNSHLKKHGEATAAALCKKDPNRYKATKVKGIDENFCKPHGCKLIQCKICLSKHSKISDLRTHLLNHSIISFANRSETTSEVSLLLYPEEPPMTEATLNARISADLQAEQLSHLYSITNEIGYELSLNSSETDTDSETEAETNIVSTKSAPVRHNYTCELCKATFNRKHKLFRHQADVHDWLEAPHVCTHCSARFVCASLLRLHQEKQCKNTQKRFVCRKCPCRFMWKDNLTNHLRTIHTIEMEDAKKKSDVVICFECVQCKRSFQMQKDLTRHMVMHRSDATALKCLWCPRKFYRQENLHMHIKRHGITPENLGAAECFIRATSGPHGTKQIHCKMCGNLQFQSIAALRLHLMQPGIPHHSIDSRLNYSITNELGFELEIDDSETDSEEDASTFSKPYTCEICSISCSRKYAMALHQRSVHKHEKLPLKCETCIFRTVSTNILEHHVRAQCSNTEKKFKCTECSLKFMWQDNLVTHMRKLHAIEETNIATDLPNINNDSNVGSTTQSKIVKIFHCEKCNCQYNRKDRLNAHMKRMHAKHPDGTDSSTSVKNVKPGDIAERNRKPECEKKFLCAFCGRAVTSSSNLIIHMRRHTGEKPFKCDFCDMAFPRSSDMQSHRRTHTGEKPHKCTVCNKAFSRSYKLQTHMRIHSGERPYKCTYCDKSFTQSNDCTLHIRRHTGERPYSCGTCGERFIQGTALKNHRTTHNHYEDMEPPKRLTLLEQF